MDALLVKKALTRKWLSQESPTLNAWMETTMEIYTMEKIIACVNYESKQFASHLVQFAHTTRSILIIFLIHREHRSV